MPNAASLWEAFQRQEGAKPRAVRKFTDRQDFRQAYYALVSRALRENFQDCYVINYYGIGGVGKSSLLRRLAVELLEDETLPEDEARPICEEARAQLQRLGQRQKPAILRADFDDAALKTPQDVLLRFRAQLMRQYDKAMFPLFDVAMLRLSQKYGRSLPPDEQKALLTDNPVISFALDVVGDFTGAGLLIGAAQTAAKVGRGVAYAMAGRKNAIKKANEEASRMDAPDLERRLPYYFAMDVNAMGLPLVCVYLDTYEKMTAQAEGAGRSTGFDEEWLRGDLGLVRNLGNAVFAIAGRERLSWFGLPFENRYVQALAEADGAGFLASCGIEDSELCAKLYRLTGGEPIYLDLCVDEYERLTASGKENLTLEDFGGSLDRLVERHTRYIPQNLRDALYLLAAMGRWTDTVCEELSRTLPIPSPGGTEYYQLTHLSYVQEDEEGWAMHRPVAQVLAGSLSPALEERLIFSLAEAAKRETQALLGGPKTGSAETGALDILDRLSKTTRDPRIAQAMEERAGAARRALRYPEARMWQEKSIRQWEALGGEYALQHGESLAGLADLLWEQLKNRPQNEEKVRGDAEGGETAQERRGWQELLAFCERVIAACEEPGTRLDGVLVRLWERRANAEDVLEKWDAAVSSWTQVAELSRKLERPEAVWRNAQLQTGWDHRLAGHWEQARIVLEDALQGLAALDREAGRAYSPKALLCGELLCQSYDALNIEAHGLWEERLVRVQSWLRPLELTVTGEESLDELLDWQDWAETSVTSYGFHSGKEGADPAERLRRIAGLDRQVIAGLEKHLGRFHPTVLNAKAALINIYMNQESAKGVGAVIDTDYMLQLMEESQRPLGSVPEKNDCFFPDPETVLSICQELVELNAVTMGREYPGTYRAKELLARACESAGRPENAIPIRQELWAYYRSAYGEGDKEALRQNLRLIEANQRAGQWSEAIALQTRRLELARTGESLPLSDEQDRLCTLYLSRLWQDELLSWEQAREVLAKLLAFMRELRPKNRKHYLDSAFQWCQECAVDSLDEIAVDVVLALADTISFADEVIGLLEPYSEEKSLSVRQRCGLLFQLGRAYRKKRRSPGRSAELLEELAGLLAAHPEVKDPDLGTALLELGLSRRKLVFSLSDDSFQEAVQEMLDALRGALAWREEYLVPEDPAVDEARFQLADALVLVGAREEAVPLLETVLAFRRKALGESARETLEAELRLVEALARTEGRYEQALALFRKTDRRMKEQRLVLFTDAARYALYRGSGGTLSSMEWEEAGRPEQS